VPGGDLTFLGIALTSDLKDVFEDPACANKEILDMGFDCTGLIINKKMSEKLSRSILIQVNV